MVLVLPVLALAQPDPQISNLSFNRLFYNPAVAGSEEGLSAAVVARNQWKKLSNTPGFSAANMHFPASHKRIGLGIYFYNQTFLIERATSLSLSYAYRINFASGVLSMGISGGVKNYTVDAGKLRIKDRDDEFVTNADYSGWSPDFSAGLFYKSEKLRAGISSAHLQNNHLISGKNYYLVQPRHYYLMADYSIPVSEQLMVEPAFLVRYLKGLPLQADLGIRSTYKKMLIAGLNYRTNNVVNVSAGLCFNSEFSAFSSFKLVYAYDWFLRETELYKLNVHELMLACIISKDKRLRNIEKQRETKDPVFF
jgi:type IX secretion system PorP/SprF family membrane protein